MNYPCKGCQERHTACWDTCEKYLAVKDKYDAYKKTIRRNVDADSHTIELMNKVKDSNAKRKKNGRLTW